MMGMGAHDSIWAAGRCEFGSMGDLLVRVALGVFFRHLRGE